MTNIKEVAKKANVSVTTVSRYLNDHPYISADKKEKIQQAMRELDYIPNSAATQLRSNKSFTIGVIVSRITNPYFAYLIEAIEKQLRDTSYHTLILQSHDDKEEELRLMNMLKQKQIDGVIMCSIENDIKTIETYTDYGPIVLVGDESLNSSKIGMIRIKHQQATYDAIEFLINKGYKEIAYCTGGKFTKSRHGSARNKGFKAAMETYKLPIQERYVFENIHTIQDGINIAEELLNQKQLPQAIFTGSDEVAAGLIQYFTAHNVNVPKNIAIIGYDNQPFSNMLKVALTTVNQPIDIIGERLVRNLISMLEDKTSIQENDSIQLSIVEREST